MADAYRAALTACRDLLVRVREPAWAAWLERDLAEWAHGRVRHHLEAFGGMGSLNDLVLSRDNGHDLAAEDEAWANALLEQLLDTSRELARSIERSAQPAWRAPSSTAATDASLTGWRCLSCGRGAVSDHAVETAIAREIVGATLRADAKTGAPRTHWDPAELRTGADADVLRARVHAALAAGDVPHSSDPPPARRCPHCHAPDVASCTWQLTPDGAHPAPGNLPLKTRRPRRRR